jgi:hypothetical protein
LAVKAVQPKQYEVSLVLAPLNKFWDRDAKLVLSDTLQAHPLLRGPEDFVRSGDSITVGPGYVLPTKKSGYRFYDGWD